MTKARQPPTIRHIHPDQSTPEAQQRRSALIQQGVSMVAAHMPQVLTRVDPAGRARLDALVRKATQQAQQPQAQ